LRWHVLFTDLVEGKMAMLISHRLSTVRTADLILLLEQRKMAESGTHAQVVKKYGKYADPFNIQANTFK